MDWRIQARVRREKKRRRAVSPFTKRQQCLRYHFKRRNDLSYKQRKAKNSRRWYSRQPAATIERLDSLKRASYQRLKADPVRHEERKRKQREAYARKKCINK